MSFPSTARLFRACSYVLLIGVCSVLITPVGSQAAPIDGQPIQALLVTGGCCHDYSTQKKIIPTGVSARANIKWTVAHQGGNSKDAKIPVHKVPDRGDKFDVIVYNQCFAAIDDTEWVRRVLKPHRNGTPAVFIHCAMHTFRSLKDNPSLWDRAMGLRSTGHKSKKPIEVKSVVDHFITKPIGKQWTTPKGELYKVSDVYDGTRTLATGQQVGSEDKHPVIWQLKYGSQNTPMFGTTLGHHNETMASKTYLNMLTRGILWTVGKSQEKHIQPEKKADRERLNDILSNAGKQSDVPEALDNKALNKRVTASSEQTSEDNLKEYAVDGDQDTRWCASDDSAPQWLRVDLGGSRTLRSVRIHWEKADTAYRYKVQTSQDGESWNTVVNASDNDDKKQLSTHSFDSVNATFLRIKYLGNDSGYWGSIWEVEAYTKKNPSNIRGASTSQVSPDMQVADPFESSVFASPPEVNYPACITATPNGHLFVGVDPQGSLGKKDGNGKILRLTDMDGDGKADRIKTFARLDHPRGLVYDRGKLWVLHPPRLTLLHDQDLDGKAERRKTLVKNVSSKWINKRGVDHAVNGMRMGIDGWLYIAVGDFGLQNTKAVDGTKLHRRGGGVIRIRPDGSDMEVFSWELRNIYDVAIGPLLNVYTRDNTNDGEGWNVRVSHIMQSARYGYPARYSDFPEEIMPPLGQYGGGSGAGALYLHDLRWPEEYNDQLYTADWGTFSIYQHDLEPVGPTFRPDQERFMTIARPTDLDIDGTGRLFVSSWKNGKFKYKGENVGYIARLKPESYVPRPPEDPSALSNKQLVQKLTSPSARQRKLYQHVLLARDTSGNTGEYLLKLAGDRKSPLYARVAAIFTLKQMEGANANPKLLKLVNQKKVKPYALRALTDHRDQLENLPQKPFVNALQDSNPDVRAQALISLGRMQAKEAADDVLPLTIRRHGNLPDEKPVHDQPDPGRVIPHLAVRTLVNMKAVTPCLEAVGGEFTEGALEALSRMHTTKAATGLIGRLKEADQSDLKKAITTTLVRLYKKEAPYRGNWWGTTPNPDGPYAVPETWAASEQIAEVLRDVYDTGNSEMRTHIRNQLEQHAMQIDGLSS